MAPAEAPARTAPPPRAAVSAVEMGAKQREISVSEFFTKNRHLLGFDSPRKALLTCVKEAVDNALDAAEEAGILPDVLVKVEVVSTNGTPPTAAQATRFRLTVADNGPGIVRQQIPPIFAKLLYGSKFHRLRMSRGQQGIGISAAGMYAQLTTGTPVRIISRTGPRSPAHYFEVQIDTKKNEPRIFESKKIDWGSPRGTQVTLEIEGRYQRGRGSVDEFLQQVAIANPHVKLVYQTPEGETREYPRTIHELPPAPKEIKPHPYGIELGLLLRMLQDTRSHSLAGFLAGDFSRVSPALGAEICKTAKLSPDTKPRNVHGAAAEALYQAIQSTKIMAPPANAISPIGEKAILHGLYTQIKGEFYTAVTRPPAVYRGNPFAIEAGLAYGRAPGQAAAAPEAPAAPLAEGEAQDDGGELARVIRYANRVPLLYQQSACATFKAALETAWRNYGVSQARGALPAGPMVIFVHVASVWVPFTSESKEAIADYDEIRKEIKLALQECGRRLGVFLRRRERAQTEFHRRNIFDLYIEEIVQACGRLKGPGLSKDTLRSQLTKMAVKRTGGSRTDEILGKDSGPEGLPHSIIVTEEGPEGEAPATPDDAPGAGGPAQNGHGAANGDGPDTGRPARRGRAPARARRKAEPAESETPARRKAASAAPGRPASPAHAPARKPKWAVARARSRTGVVLKKLVGVADSVVTAAERSKDPTLAIPVRSLANVSFNPKRGIIELGRRKQERTLFNVGMAKKFMQTVLVADALAELQRSDLTTSLREIYYRTKHTMKGSHENTFDNQNESDPLIEDLEVTLSALREELHVRAENAGSVVGPLVLVDDGDRVDCARLGKGGYSVPSIVEPEEIRIQRCTADFVLLVEKGTQWNRLSEDKFWRRYNCVLLTGNGQPPRGVRRLARRLHEEHGLPVYVLVDNDPWGYYIYSVVKQGSINLAFESERMAIPKAKFIGLSSADPDHYGLPRNVGIKLNDKDVSRAKELLRYRWFEKKPWQEEIKRMLSIGLKYELDALANKDFRYLTKTYLPRKLKEGDWLD